MAKVEEFSMAGLEWMEQDADPGQAHQQRMDGPMLLGTEEGSIVVGDLTVSLTGKRSKQAQLGNIPYSESAYSGEPVMVVMELEPNPEANPWGIEYARKDEGEPEEEALVLAETVQEAIALLQSLIPEAIPTQTRLLTSHSLD